MEGMQITIGAYGWDEAARQLSPKQAQTALILWFDRGTKYTKSQLRAMAPQRLKGKVRSMTDGLIPPKWARIFVKSPLAHLIEGGTGSMGAAGFNHVPRHWPSTEGIIEQTGLPRSQAYAMARAIGMRGGNPARPFVQPTFEMVHGRLNQMAQDVLKEVFE